jgi:transposase-like protein
MLACTSPHLYLRYWRRQAQVGAGKTRSEENARLHRAQAQAKMPQIGRASLQRAPFVQLDWIAQSKRIGA